MKDRKEIHNHLEVNMHAYYPCGDDQMTYKIINREQIISLGLSVMSHTQFCEIY